jgi:hypothetical protein
MSELVSASIWAVDGSWDMVLLNLTWTELGAGLRCVVVEVPHWRVTAGEPLMVVTGQCLTSRRPLGNDAAIASRTAWAP